jgi:PadR family transcriptional regulator PadR
VSDRRQQWLRGVLDLCVLATLHERERHGYAISSRLEKAGLARVKGGTLYPVLARLHAGGLVVARWEPGHQGPGRKYYSLTDAGSALLREQGRAWIAFAGTTQKLIDPGGSS